MQKSTEERLADIESGVTRLTKMQACVYEILRAQHKISTFIINQGGSLSSLEQSAESVHQIRNYSLTFMFGTIAALGISASMTATYPVTKDLLTGILGLSFWVLSLVFFVFSFRYHRLANRESKKINAVLSQKREKSQSVREEAASLDEALAQALAEWEELVPDDSISEFKNKATESNDSHDRN